MCRGVEDDRLLSEQIGDQPRAVVIVDAEDLQDAGVRERTCYGVFPATNLDASEALTEIGSPR